MQPPLLGHLFNLDPGQLNLLILSRTLLYFYEVQSVNFKLLSGRETPTNGD